MSDRKTSADGLAIQVDGQTPESWAEILAQFTDASIYQSWAYGAVRWGAAKLSHFVLRRDGQPVAAAQLRIARLPIVPAGLAYLRWGMFENKSVAFDPVVASALAAGLRQEYGVRRGLALQIIPSVYCGSANVEHFQVAFERAALTPDPLLGQYKTVMVDLSPAIEVIRKQLNQKWRNQLNRAEKNGLALEVSDTSAAYEAFVPLYASMWERKQFESSVDVEEFGRMQGVLTGAARLQTFLARSEGVVVGALVCSLMGDTAVYLLGATNERARELKAAYFLQWQAMLWLKERGARRYDLGGIDEVANPGGYHFKSGFGGAEVTQLVGYSHRGNLLSNGVAAFAAWRRRSRVATGGADQAGTPSSAETIGK